VTEREFSPTGESPELSLELEGELRLLPQQMQLGRAELLTDALTLPFTDIESRLGRYALHASESDRAALIRSMKRYLGRLNANPHIPLAFRLKVLNRFEQELDLFDAEMTAAVLNAHKVGVLLVQQAAREDRAYYPTLIEMIANAMELATRLLRMNLERYRAPVVIVTRQCFDLARLGLGVSAAMHDEAPSIRERFYRALCNHEMLRKLDLFSCPQTAQQQIWHELQYHVGVLKPRLMQAGSHDADASGCRWMVINLNRPNDAGRMLSALPNPMPYDCIVIAMDALIERVETAVAGVATIMADRSAQRQSLHTEHALESTYAGGRAILRALRNEKRTADRRQAHDITLQLLTDAPRALMLASGADGADAKSAPLDARACWTLIDSNDNGICLERMAGDLNALQPGTLVGLRWRSAHSDPGHQAMPTLAFVCWIRIRKAGEQRIGLRFMEPGYRLARAVVPGIDREMDRKRTWPVLVRPGEAEHTMLFPNTGVYRQMAFIVQQGARQAHFKISEVIASGSNYTLCRIIHARTGVAGEQA